MEQKVALVTAASRGIGLACSLELARQGFTVAMGVRRVEDAWEICQQQLPFRLFPVYFDASQPDRFQQMIAETLQHAGRIDVLVNNFGMGRPQYDLDLLNGKEDVFFELFEANAGSVYRICKLVIPYMIAQGGGSIVNISSIGGVIPDITRLGYGVSKAAVNNITLQIALQYAQYGIRCNAVLPGLTATDAALQNMPESFLASFLSHVPLKRMAKPEEIAQAVCFFATEKSSYVTGQIMEVSGGYGLGTPQYAEMIGKNTNKQKTT